MSAAPIVIIVTRPRPPQARAYDRDPEPESISVIGGEDEATSAILRRAADQLDAGPTLPPSS